MDIAHRAMWLMVDHKHLSRQLVSIIHFLLQKTEKLVNSKVVKTAQQEPFAR